MLAFCNSCYSRSPSIDPATYHDVFALFYTSLMNGFVCSYCGCEMDLVSADHQVSVDHVVPLARGGTNDITNLVLCCRHCNTQKASMTVEQWTAKRRRNGGRMPDNSRGSGKNWCNRHNIVRLAVHR